MINEEKLSAVLCEFARTVITDFPIQAILDHLVHRIVEVLPITSAGVTLIEVGHAPHYIAASDEAALIFEKLQTRIGDGPCVAAFETGVAVAIPDMTKDARFPVFARAASAAGLAAAFTFPLRHGKQRLGALDLYRDAPGELDPADTEAAQTLADVASAYLLNAGTRHAASVEADRLLYLSTHDPLTGLANRSLFQQRLEHAALRAVRTTMNTAVLFVDLDGFKLVNDNHGHSVGDELLVAVAGRLTALVRLGDTLARFSGDEFVFLCENVFKAADMDGLGRRISDAFRHPFMIGGVAIEMKASVGVAYAGSGQEISKRMIVDADRAMYAAKNRGGGHHRIIEIRSPRERQRSSWEKEFGAALAGGELDVVYQPIVRVLDGLITGVEALLRWNHPQDGLISPQAMITLAERSGLIADLGVWVLDRACRDWHTWSVDNPTVGLGLAVNISARQLLDPCFAGIVTEIIAATEMEPAALTLEITEGVLVDDSDVVIRSLSRLRVAGTRVAVDDFGTGYSSLSYLGRLPIDIIKIDRCFTADTATATGQILVRAITSLGHDLGFAVIAEGVETREEHDLIASLGCELAQGFYYGRPMAASAIGTHCSRPA